MQKAWLDRGQEVLGGVRRLSASGKLLAGDREFEEAFGVQVHRAAFGRECLG